MSLERRAWRKQGLRLGLRTVLCEGYWPTAVQCCAQSCLTLCDLVDCSLPGSSVHEIFQARIPKRVTIFSSMGSSLPRMEFASPALQKDCLRLSHQAKLLKDSFSGLLCSYMWHTSNQVLMDTFGREFWKVSINKNTKSGRKLLSSLLLPGMWMWWLTLQQTPASWSYHKDGSYTPGSWPKKQKTWLFFFFF